MASRVEYAVSMTPVRTIAASGDYDAHDVIANDIGKSLGGRASSATAAEDHVTDYGPYMKADSDGETKATTSAKMVFIKHTGKAWSSASELGSSDVSAALVVSVVGSTDTIQIASIAKGGAILLPSPGDTTLKLVCSSDLAVEYAIID